MADVMTSKPADSIKVGDVILPPERELRLWMRRDCAARGLPETALHLTVLEVHEGNPDKRGRWLVVRCNRTAEWSAKPYPFTFKARPETPWPIVSS